MHSFTRICCVLGFLLCLTYRQCNGQRASGETVVFSDSVFNYIGIEGFGGSSALTPFWMQANQFGTVSKTSPAFSVCTGWEKYHAFGKPESKIRNEWRVGIGVEAVTNISENKKLLIPQLHVTLRYKNWELYAGRKKQWVGLADSTLGSGSYVWSGNALPIPKIYLGTTDFVAIPFTKGWMSFRAFYSDGWFESNRPVTSNLKLHQKALYARIGKANSALKFYGGFNHQVQWGGSSPYNTEEGEMPAGFKNYINAVTGKAHSENSGVFDNTGRVGNHLGTIDLGIEIETYSASIFLYRQNIYEDGSLFWLSNIQDGLNGIRFRRKNNYGSAFTINTILLEYLYTKSQGGAVADWDKPSWMRGKDDYFNNGQVRDGWGYYDRTIGTPFISPTSSTHWKWPAYADFFTSNNRVSVLHLGLSGYLFKQISWTGKFSWSDNYGTYDQQFENNPGQFSGLITIQSKLNFLGGVFIKSSFASDLGQLYPANSGFSLGLQKVFPHR